MQIFPNLYLYVHLYLMPPLLLFLSTISPSTDSGICGAYYNSKKRRRLRHSKQAISWGSVGQPYHTELCIGVTHCGARWRSEHTRLYEYADWDPLHKHSQRHQQDSTLIALLQPTENFLICKLWMTFSPSLTKLLKIQGNREWIYCLIRVSFGSSHII